MNSRGIYVLPDSESNNIAFYYLSSFWSSPIIKPQSGHGWRGSCAFMDEDTVICSTQSTGNIYKYSIANNYHQQFRIASNDPSGNGFQTLLVTRNNYILAAYRGCIYIYTSSGAYVDYSNSSETQDMHQMKEVKPNIILTAEVKYIYSHNISNPRYTKIYKLLDYANTNTKYYTIEVLEWNIGDIAIGGITDSGDSGYVELFHIYENNSGLQSIPNKRWVEKNTDCYINIIREIQVGVIIFGGDYDCAYICTWEYARTYHQDPTCFPLGGERYIWDIIALPNNI